MVIILRYHTSQFWFGVQFPLNIVHCTYRIYLVCWTTLNRPFNLFILKFLLSCCHHNMGKFHEHDCMVDFHWTIICLIIFDLILMSSMNAEFVSKLMYYFFFLICLCVIVVWSVYACSEVRFFQKQNAWMLGVIKIHVMSNCEMVILHSTFSDWHQPLLKIYVIELGSRFSVVLLIVI